jgi:guanine deaminase
MEENNCFALKGNIFYSESSKQIQCIPNGYIVCEDGNVIGVYNSLPLKYEQIEVIDYGDKLIIPGLVDLHTHAPQYSFRGLGMDLELLNWLNQNTFPEEAKFSDINYALKSYSIFVEDIKNSATTRACIFGTVHGRATSLLMDLLEETGLKCMVGKVNMDRNCPDYLVESKEDSIAETKKWLKESNGKYKNITPILTPRFLPTCSDSLLEELSLIQKDENIPVQSHLSENLAEIDWVKELFPKSKSYGQAYDDFDLFGKGAPTIMAHCVYLTDEEMQLIKENDVFIAHCPESNTNLSSGIAPIRKYLERELKIGLGTDMAGGSSNSIFKTMVSAVKVSKLYWRLVNQEVKPLTLEEAFYLGTKGGGAFFGKVGSFETGYELDAVVIDDSTLKHPQEFSLKERLERVIYLSDDRHIFHKYIAGKKIELTKTICEFA